MNNIQKHSKKTFFFSLSRMLERASYYGLRSIIFLYMVSETLSMNDTEAIKIYSWIGGSLIISQFIGALFGDLVIGNKKPIVIGGITQAIGASSLYIPSTSAFYIGLMLIIIGNGFYTSNIISNFGKSYLNKTKLLDSGFTIFYLAVNIGAFLGVLVIGYVGYHYGHRVGFLISGLLMLLSIIPIVILKENNLNETIQYKMSIGKRFLTVSIAFIVVGLFWSIYEISSIRFLDLQVEFDEISSLDVPRGLWESSSIIFVLPICLIAIFFWTHHYITQFSKLIIGLIFGVISFGTLVLIPEIPTDAHTIIFIILLLFFSISEIHIAPIIQSIFTRYTNPKYLAISINLAFLPAKVFLAIFSALAIDFYDHPMLGLKIGIGVLSIIAVVLFAFVFWNKKIYPQHLI